eukprot:49129_1
MSSSHKYKKQARYKPKTVVKWDSDSNWVCYCSSGPEKDWSSNDIQKAIVECSNKNCKNWGHILCYHTNDKSSNNLIEAYKNEKKFEEYNHQCMKCQQSQIIYEHTTNQTESNMFDIFKAENSHNKNTKSHENDNRLERFINEYKLQNIASRIEEEGITFDFLLSSELASDNDINDIAKELTNS